MVDGEERSTIGEAAEEHLLVHPNPNAPGVYMSGIDAAIPRKGLENRLSEAQEACHAIETKLEELFHLKAGW